MATNKPSPLAGKPCPKCRLQVPAKSASLDNMGICPSCDAVLELRPDGSVRVIDDQEIERLDLAVRSAIVLEHCDLEFERVLSSHPRFRLVN